MALTLSYILYGKKIQRGGEDMAPSYGLGKVRLLFIL